jgi:hypothetical protein
MEKLMFGWRTQKVLTSTASIYSLVALTVLWPLLAPGFILTLDMVFTPQIRLPEAGRSSYLFYAVLHAFNLVLPSEILQKVMLFLILFLSGLGMHRLYLYTMQDEKTQTKGAAPAWLTRWPPYIAGVLYMINPFTYSRFMAGQFAVLLGYALLPFFARMFLGFLAQPSPWAALRLGLLTATIGIVSIHTLGLVIVLGLVGLGLCAWRFRSHLAHLKHVLLYGVLALAVAGLASSYWAVPLIQGKGSTAQAISNFGQGDRQAFETLGGSTLGRTGNVLSLKGFWGENANLYMLPEDYYPAWRFVIIGLWGLVIVGGIALWRSKGRFVLAWLALSAAIATVLAAGGLNGWLGEHIPYASGYREPQKFAALIALAFALAAGWGVNELVNHHWQQKVIRPSVLIGSVLLIIALTPKMFWGFNGQLSTRHYPADWYQANSLLNADPDRFRVLFVPWHLYAHFRFVNRNILSPAPAFFDKPTLTSDDLEFGNASPNKPDPQKKAITRLLADAKPGSHLGAKLASYGVKYILLSREPDAARYNFLNDQQDIRLLSAGPYLNVYQNMAWGPNRQGGVHAR